MEGNLAGGVVCCEQAVILSASVQQGLESLQLLEEGTWVPPSAGRGCPAVLWGEPEARPLGAVYSQLGHFNRRHLESPLHVRKEIECLDFYVQVLCFPPFDTFLY